MLLRTLKNPRRGTHAVEAAFVYPVTFMLMLGILVCGMGIFRYQEISHWSHQAARWAACHGGQSNGFRRIATASVRLVGLTTTT